MRAAKRGTWTWYQTIVIGLLLSQVVNLQLIYYRLRTIDDPKEVHIMMPQMNSSAIEASR